MRIAGVLVIAMLALALAACGGGSDGGEASPPPPPAAETETDESENGEESSEEGAASEGAAAYVSAGCGGCHTFEAAGSTASIGPSLDSTTLTVEQIEVQVREGSGAMPAFAELLSDEEIQALAEYITGSS